jgi:hypothetical protein
VVKIKKSNLSRKIALAKIGSSPTCVEFSPYPFLSRLKCSCSTSSNGPQSFANNNSSTPRYDASYLSELKASTPRSRPATDNRNESYSVDLPMDDDMMLVDDITGNGRATVLFCSFC